MVKLSSFLIRSTCLLSLDLTNNQISGEGGFAISLVLKENTRLKVLKLAMNKIDDNNANNIIMSLTKNEFLEELDLSSNQMEEYVRFIKIIYSNFRRLRLYLSVLKIIKD